MALHTFQQINGLGPGKHANPGGLAGISKRNAHHVGFVLAFIGLRRVLRHFSRRIQRDQRHVLRIVGKKRDGEILVGGGCPIHGTGNR